MTNLVRLSDMIRKKNWLSRANPEKNDSAYLRAYQLISAELLKNWLLAVYQFISKETTFSGAFI